jgi:hypothetical protein
LLVCEGHDCVKRGADALAERLGRVGIEATRVRCQKICDGPVIGVGGRAKPTWFERVDSAKAECALIELVDGGGLDRRLDPQIDRQLDKVLRKRRVRAREGKLRD